MIILYKLLFLQPDFTLEDGICNMMSTGSGGGAGGQPGGGAGGGAGGQPGGPPGGPPGGHPWYSTPASLPHKEADRENVLAELQELANRDLKKQPNYSTMSYSEKHVYCVQHIENNLADNAMEVIRETNTIAMNPEVNSEYRILSRMLRDRVFRSGAVYPGQIPGPKFPKFD